MNNQQFETEAKRLTGELVDCKRIEAGFFEQKGNHSLTWDQLKDVEFNLFIAQTNTVKKEKELSSLRAKYIEEGDES